MGMSDYIRFRESDSYDDRHEMGRKNDKRSNLFYKERYGHISSDDDPFFRDYDPSYKDQYGSNPSFENSVPITRWPDDMRAHSSFDLHRGKGPKGYIRSKDLILDEACERLARDWYLDASGIEVSFANDCLTLKGEVKSRKEKVHAEALVENIIGVEDVFNQIRVRKKDEV
jgi:hypothetical protein